MRAMWHCLTVLGLVPALGCVTIYEAPLPQPPLPAVAPQPTPTPPAQQSEEDRLTVAEAISLCKAVQDSADLPISCDVTYLDGRPSMFVGFTNLTTAHEYWGAMSEVVTAPFCQATNSANRQAFVFVALVHGEVARLFACATGEWTESVSYSDETF